MAPKLHHNGSKNGAKNGPKIKPKMRLLGPQNGPKMAPSWPSRGPQEASWGVIQDAAQIWWPWERLGGFLGRLEANLVANMAPT